MNDQSLSTYRFEPIGTNLYAVRWHGRFIGAVRRDPDIIDLWYAQVGHHDIGHRSSRLGAAQLLAQRTNEQDRNQP